MPAPRMPSISSPPPVPSVVDNVPGTLPAEADVLVIGGGIAGVAAALRLQDRGLTPLVLEREAKVGGRMTTDRIDGFAIDRGVTLLGNQFTRMRALCFRLGLQPRMVPASFSFGLRCQNDTVHSFRAGRVDDILRSGLLSSRAKQTFLKLSADLALHSPGLSHGQSERAVSLDDKTASDYFRHLGGDGGAELFDQLFVPGLIGPVGGDPWKMSRAVMMQVVWNVLVRGTWNLSGGVDGIPEAIAAQVPVRTGCRVLAVRDTGKGVLAEVESSAAKSATVTARAACFALPGHLVPSLFPDLPEWLSEPLTRTQYARMVSVHIALTRPPDAPYPGYSFASGIEDGVEIEMEHLRAPENNPPGQGLVSLYFYPSASPNQYQDLDEDHLRTAAVQILERTFPEVTGTVRFIHVVRWENGIARFPLGRLSEMVRLRERLQTWDAPFDLCGDYLDGIASEAALRTGEQAADRLADKLRG